MQKCIDVHFIIVELFPIINRKKPIMRRISFVEILHPLGGYVRDLSAIAIASRTMLPQFFDDTPPQPSLVTMSSTPSRLAISCFKGSDINFRLAI